METHRRIAGDRYRPIGAQLLRNGSPVDVTGLSVQFKLVADDGTVIVNWASATIVDADNGQVQYDLTSQNATDAVAGDYWAWFRIGDGTEWETFPPGGREWQIVVSNAA